MNSKDNISDGFKDLLVGINKELGNNSAKNSDLKKVDHKKNTVSSPRVNDKSNNNPGGTRVFDTVKNGQSSSSTPKQVRPNSLPGVARSSSHSPIRSANDKSRASTSSERHLRNPNSSQHTSSNTTSANKTIRKSTINAPTNNIKGGVQMANKNSTPKSRSANKTKNQQTGCLSSFVKFFIYMVFIVVASAFISGYIIGVGNDMFAFVKDTYNFSETVYSVKGETENTFKITKTKVSGNKFIFDYKFGTPLTEEEKKSVDASIVLIDTKDNSVACNYGKFSDYVRDNESISVDLSTAQMTNGNYVLRLTVNTANNISYITEFTVSKKVVDVKIEEGASALKVAKQLKKQGIIDHPTVFSIYASYKKGRSSSYYGKDYISGTHQLYPGMSYDDLIAKLSPVASSRQIVKLTFPEGSTVDEIIDILIKGGVENTKEEYIDVINNYEFDYKFVKMLDESDLPKGRLYRLEGYLFPDTYEFYTDASPAAVINKFLTNFNNKFDNIYYEEAQKKGLSVDEIIRIASIVELEAGNAADRENISSVFHNRLKSLKSASSTKFLYMQSDATTDYASINFNSDFKLNDNNSSGSFSIDLSKYNLTDADYYFNLNINTGKTRSVALIHLNKTTSNDGKVSYKITSQTVSNDAQTSAANDLNMSITKAEIKGTTFNCQVKLNHSISKDNFKNFKINLNLFRTDYNTYLSQGLMPSAVANPGYDSITAALYPNSTNYYYFVADKYGKSHFSATNEQHNNKINELNRNGNAAKTN